MSVGSGAYYRAESWLRGRADSGRFVPFDLAGSAAPRAPPHAPFLKGADLLVASDCTAFAYAGFHRDFLQGRALLTGCPKLDDSLLYADKFVEIFRQNDIRSVTVVVMEVPCCQGMPLIVKAGMKAAGVSVPLETVVVSVGGGVVERRQE